MLGFICSVLLTTGAILPAEAYHLNRSHSYMGHYKTRTFLGHTVSGKSLKTIALVTAKGLCVWKGTWHSHAGGAPLRAGVHAHMHTYVWMLENHPVSYFSGTFHSHCPGTFHVGE